MELPKIPRLCPPPHPSALHTYSTLFIPRDKLPTGHDQIPRRKHSPHLRSTPPRPSKRAHCLPSHRPAFNLRLLLFRLSKDVVAVADASGAKPVAVLHQAPHHFRAGFAHHHPRRPFINSIKQTNRTVDALATMLLPSALPCDVRPPLTRSRFSASRLFSSPPPSDDEVASQVGNGIYSTCRALQSFLGTQKQSMPKSAKPPQLLAPITLTSRMKVSKKSHKAAPRGANKRRRDVDDDGRVAIDQGDVDLKFSTPKRQRLAPPDLPLGVKRADFEGLQSPIARTAAEGETGEADDDEWSAEEDRVLVELVLEKLKLTKSDWNECARRLGKDSASIGKRWKELVGDGNVGLRRGRRISRPKIDSTWR